MLDDLDRAEQHGDLTGAFKTVADKLADTLDQARADQGRGRG